MESVESNWQEAFTCCICLDVFREPILVTTKCGHSFCEQCIVPCLPPSTPGHPYSGPCPVCKTAVSAGDLIRNYQLERVVSIIRSQGAIKSTGGADGSLLAGLIASLQPKTEELCDVAAQMEQAAREHIARSVLNWNRHWRNVAAGYTTEKLRLESEYGAIIKRKQEEYVAKGLQSEATDLELRHLRMECQQRIGRIETDRMAASKKVVDAFSTVLSMALANSLPHAIAVPITIEVVRAGMDTASAVQNSKTAVLFSLPLVLTAETTIRQVKTLLISHYRDVLHDPLVPDAFLGVCFVLTNPTSARPNNTSMDIDGGTDDVREIALDDEARPLMQAHTILPGDVLLVIPPILFAPGSSVSTPTEEYVLGLRTQSSALKRCFTVAFHATSNRVCDYYVCETCKLQWICSVCKEHCHAGHTCKMQIRSKDCQQGRCFCFKSRCQALHSHDAAAGTKCFPESCPNNRVGAAGASPSP